MQYALVKNHLTNWRERFMNDNSEWRLLHSIFKKKTSKSIKNISEV